VRKIVQKHGAASVIPLRAAQPEQVCIELGIDEDEDVLFMRMSRGGIQLAVGMTADRAEAFAVDLMQFVHELRRGGLVG